MPMSETAHSPSTGTPPPARRFPPVFYLIGGVVIAIAPTLFAAFGGASAVQAFFFGLYERFSLIEPFNLMPIYFDHYRACDGPEGTSCGGSNPLKFFSALLSTGVTVINTFDGLTAAFLLMAMVYAFFGSLAVIKRLFDTDTNIGSTLGAAVATPIVISVGAFVLKWIAMFLSIFLAYVVSALLWAGAILRKTWNVYKEAKNVRENAQTLEELHKTAVGMFKKSPPPKP
jgi:hypothetical protein